MFRFEDAFEDTFTYSNVYANVAGHRLAMRATHHLDNEDYLMPGYEYTNELGMRWSSSYEMYCVCFSIDGEHDVEYIEMTRLEKVAVCKMLKLMWRELVSHIQAEVGEAVAFKCLPYLEDGRGRQRVANYKKQGFVAHDIHGYVYIP